jgi:signal transduction histidine kinase
MKATNPQAFSGQHSLTVGIIRRVGLLGFLIVLAILGLLVVSLSISFQNSHISVANTATSASKELDLFLADVETNLENTGHTLNLIDPTLHGLVLQDILARYSAIFEISVVRLDGSITLQRRRVGQSQTDTAIVQPWLDQVTAGKLYISPVDTAEFGVPFITVAAPLYDGDAVVGSLTARLELTALWNLIIAIRAGSSGYAYMVDGQGTVLAFRDLSVVQQKQTIQALIGESPQDLLDSGQQATRSIHTGLGGGLVLSSTALLEKTSWFVVVEVPLAEPLSQLLPSLIFMMFILGVTLYVVLNIANYTRQRIVIPLRALREGVGKIQQGDLTHVFPQLGAPGDEVDVLTVTMNNVTNRLNELINTLENRVVIRTRDLEIAAEVSRQITTVLDTNELLTHVVEATLTSFRLYYVAVFLYDNATQRLKIQTGTGDAGQQMKVEALQFDLASRGLIPKAGHTRKVVLVDDIQLSPDYVAVPFLPYTRSELVLPMLIGERLIGVLDLQADEVGRFSPEDIRVMSSLASQTAIAVRNAELYAEARQSREAAEESNRVKSQFLASMSHELRTPLNAILNFSQFVATGMLGEVNDQQVDVLNKVVSSGKHLLSLINDVLDISKIESGALKLFVEPNIHLDNELDAAVNATKILLNDKPVKIITQIHGEIPAMIGDKRRLRQIVLNLFSNACKFTETGSITLELSANTQEITLAVHDTGPGIDPKDYELIFETFRQSETGLRQGEGTGLGLPISRRLAEAHGGRLWLTSVIGHGSSFYVALPIEADILKPLLKVKEPRHD